MAGALTSTEYQLLVEHSPVMIWRAGLDSGCDYFNAVWLAYTGRTLGQELGNGWAEGVHAEDLPRCLSIYLEHFGRRAPFEMEYRLRRHDGAYRWILDRGVPFADAAGVFAGFIGSCVDVDERRRAQEEQQRQNQARLMEARDFEKWILAIVSHDIRNPLGNIRMATALLRRPDLSTAVAARQVEVVGRGVDRIEHIVGDLLDLSRVREGLGVSVQPAPLDLAAMCQQFVDDLRAQAPGRRIEFENGADGHGAWDPHRLPQAISNLTSNAIKHGVPGSPVLLRLGGDAHRVVVAVRNEGAIPAELLACIFEPFRSTQQHARRGDGLGLGLFIARTIAHAHGGTLEVDSADGMTEFRLLLPRRCPVDEAG